MAVRLRTVIAWFLTFATPILGCVAPFRSRWHGESNDIGLTKVDAVFIAESDPFIIDGNVITPPGHTGGVATTACSDDFLLEFH